MREVVIRGERLRLDHRKALFWPAQRALILADTHFGKSAVFRREGIALPEGSDAEDLAVISSLVRDHVARRLYILGDFVHGALPSGHRFYKAFRTWRAQHADLEIHVVLGNHDIHLDRSALRDVQWHDRLGIAPFELVHDPEDADSGYYLAGHIHPVVRLSTRSDSLCMPVFWQRDTGMVLPSFGALTGGYAVSAKRRDRLYAAGPELVTDLTSAG
jgi:DNA ligase-associated metallophosphoesterase